MMSKRLLIIEDDKVDQKMMKKNLEKAGFGPISVAASGEEGLEMVRTVKPQVVIVDTNLPGIDGHETCRQLKQSVAPDLKIIVMTGAVDAVDAGRAQHAGADEYVVKTVNFVHVIEAVKKVTGGGSPDRPWNGRKTNEAIKTLYHDLEHKNEELKKLDRMKSKFVSMVSHELRTPLSIIVFSTDNLLAGAFGTLTKEQRQWLERISENALHLVGLLGEILDLSKLESEKEAPPREQFDAAAVLSRTVSDMQVVAEQKKVRLQLEAPRSSPKIWGSPRQWTQVVTNLLGNALKFTPSGGTVQLRLEDAGEEILLSVADTGPGIAPADLEKIFEPFVQADNQPEKGAKGIGLGLAICREIVCLHHGRIWAESAVGQGTTFFVVLPKDPRQ